MDNLDYLNQRASRQVTSLSYDLVDSSGQMNALGVERYVLWLDQIHTAFKEIASRWEGIVDVAQGDDGCMCYFGAIVSTEHARESALLAAIEMRDRALGLGWEVRFGMAYGATAVNQDQPYGPSVHLAARLQKLASSGQILVSCDLVDVVSHKFAFKAPVLLPEIKGFAVGQYAAHLLSKNETSYPQHPLAPANSQKPNLYLIGRQQLLRRLHQVWLLAQKKRGQSLCLVGGAGVGKTTLVTTFISSLHAARSTVLFLRCFPENKNIPFAPISNFLFNRFKLTLSDTETEREQKLSVSSIEQGFSQDSLWAIRHLIGLPRTELTPSFEDPQSFQHELMQVMIDWVTEVSQTQTILLVVEDSQWADEASTSFLISLQPQIHSSSVMLLATQRITEKDTSDNAAYAVFSQSLAVDPLNFEESAALIDRIGADLNLDFEMTAILQERSQGVPLLIEESIKLLRKPEAQLKILAAKNLSIGLPVPSSVQELFMQKLDNLGAARAFAQICSALGTEFNRLLIDLVIKDFAPHLSGQVVVQMMDILLSEGVLSNRHSSVGVVYLFKHALIQDTAYQSMWDTDKKKVHACIANILECEFSQIATTQPHVIGRHHFLAEQYPKALHFNSLAAELYKRGGSHVACINVLELALSCVNMMPAHKDTLKTKVNIQLQLAGQNLVAKGYGSAQTGEHFLKAAELCAQLEDGPLLSRAHLGLHTYYLTRGDFAEAKALMVTAKQLHVPTAKPLASLLWLSAEATMLFHHGHIPQAMAKMQDCMDLSQQQGLGHHLVQSPYLLSLMYRSYCLWAVGETELAWQACAEGAEFASNGKIRLAKVQAFGFLSMILYMRGEWDAALAASQTAVQSCGKGEYTAWLAHARFMGGAARTKLGEQENGCLEMIGSEKLWASTGSSMTRSFYLCTLADHHLSINDFAAAKGFIEQAKIIVNLHGEGYFSTDVCRVEACLAFTLQETSDWPEQALSLLQHAYNDAQARGLHSMALRVAISRHELDEKMRHAGHLQRFEPAAGVWLQDTLKALKPDATGIDIDRARQCLAMTT